MFVLLCLSAVYLRPKITQDAEDEAETVRTAKVKEGRSMCHKKKAAEIVYSLVKYTITKIISIIPPQMLRKDTGKPCERSFFKTW